MNNEILDDALTSEERDEFDKLKAEREVESSMLKGIIATGLFAMIVLEAFFYFGFVLPEDQYVEAFIGAFYAAFGFAIIAIIFLGARKNY
jgi:uncharacterized membrane protein